LREGGVKILTKLINTIYESWEWAKDFTVLYSNASLDCMTVFS